jgi:signal transduction histidine kinase
MPHSDYSFPEPMVVMPAPHDGGAHNGIANGLLAHGRWSLGRDEEIAIISHELRNSLAVISGATRALSLSAANASTTSAVAETAHTLIERHVRLMSRHIEDLLAPPQTGGDGQLKRLRIDLRVVARQAADSIQPEIARRRHHFTVSLPEQAVWAYADGDRLGQVVSNLLINAAKFTPAAGDIALSLEQAGDSVCVRVRDNGIGIDAATLPRVFDMFVQGDPRASPDSGRGIGLAVARNLVELHGGTVSAQSAGLGKGSEFTIRLPILHTV